MTSRFATLIEPDRNQPARTLHIVDRESYDSWIAGQAVRVRTLLGAQRFKGTADGVALIPGDGDDDWVAVAGVKSAATLGPWSLAKAAETLPEGSYRLAGAALGAAAVAGCSASTASTDTARMRARRVRVSC